MIQKKNNLSIRVNIRLNIDSLNIRPNIRPNIGLNVRKNAIQVKKDFYYSPSAEAGVFSTEIKKPVWIT